MLACKWAMPGKVATTRRFNAKSIWYAGLTIRIMFMIEKAFSCPPYKIIIENWKPAEGHLLSTHHTICHFFLSMFPLESAYF